MSMMKQGTAALGNAAKYRNLVYREYQDMASKLGNKNNGLLAINSIMNGVETRYGLFVGAVTDAVVAYNAGFQAVINCRGMPNYRETRQYVINVVANYQRIF